MGTSALRRRAQLLAARPDLEVCELRGNVDTRLAKRGAGEVDVLVLAAAGPGPARRRGEAGALLHDGVFVPAAGQGVIAIQARTGSPAARRRCAPTTRPPTPRWTPSATSCARSRRPATRRSACSPTGGRVRGFVGLPDGSEWLVEEAATRRGAGGRRCCAAGAVELLRALTP